MFSLPAVRAAAHRRADGRDGERGRPGWMCPGRRRATEEVAPRPREKAQPEGANARANMFEDLFASRTNDAVNLLCHSSLRKGRCPLHLYLISFPWLRWPIGPTPIPLSCAGPFSCLTAMSYSEFSMRASRRSCLRCQGFTLQSWATSCALAEIP